MWQSMFILPSIIQIPKEGEPKPYITIDANPTDSDVKPVLKKVGIDGNVKTFELYYKNKGDKDWKKVPQVFSGITGGEVNLDTPVSADLFKIVPLEPTQKSIFPNPKYSASISMKICKRTCNY
jgi:hypothetical protein